MMMALLGEWQLCTLNGRGVCPSAQALLVWKLTSHAVRCIWQQMALHVNVELLCSSEHCLLDYQKLHWTAESSCSTWPWWHMFISQ